MEGVRSHRFPRTLVHVTRLDSLYAILRSGYLYSRAQTGAPRGFAATNSGDPRYVYLSLDLGEVPLPGQVKLVLDSSILFERDDYYLNTDWRYGVTRDSLGPSQLETWLALVKGPGEILFSHEIPLDRYLVEIVVAQASPHIVDLVRQSSPTAQFPLLDLNEVPIEYRDKQRVVHV